MDNNLVWQHVSNKMHYCQLEFSAYGESRMRSSFSQYRNTICFRSTLACGGNLPAPAAVTKLFLAELSKALLLDLKKKMLDGYRGHLQALSAPPFPFVRACLLLWTAVMLTRGLTNHTSDFWQSIPMLDCTDNIIPLKENLAGSNDSYILWECHFVDKCGCFEEQVKTKKKTKKHGCDS